MIRCLLYLVTSSTSVSAYVHTPLWLGGRSEQLHVNSSVRGVSAPVVMKVVYRSPVSEYLRWRSPSGPSVVSLGEYEFIDPFVDRNSIRNNNIIELEVGPGSHFMRNITSVAVFKHTSQLVLNSTEQEFFHAACQEDSLSIIPFFASPSVALGWISSSLSGDFFMHQGRRSVIFSGILDSAMFLLPQELGTEVHDILVSSGASPAIPEYRGEMRFTNCFQTRVVADLPTFELILTDLSGTIISRIGLSGDDYMLFDLVQHTCRSKFHVRGPGDDFDSFIIDPFQLPGINVRATDSDISFCDAI